MHRRDFLRSVSIAAAASVPGTGLLETKLSAQRVASLQIPDLVAADRILAAHEIVDAYGHVSTRSDQNPQHFFMSRSLAPELVTAEDILEYDLDCNVIGGSKAPVFLERFIHGEVYKARPDVKAVVHCHTPSLIPFGATDVPLRPMFGLAGFIAEGIPVFEIRKTAGMTDLLVSNPARGKALAATLGNKPAALLRGHGAVVTAVSIPLVVGRCVYLDMNAKVQYQAMAMSKNVTYLTPEEGKQSVADDYRRAWQLWRRKAMGN